ncbi:glycosyltransferase family 2 protein [Budvicia aquatica]|nr:glycosyltransferase [Budvicia aquatica]VFS53055.1 Hyaluronan synthase [Budvicia aquatica]
MIKLSVVVSSYNNNEYIQECLDSILPHLNDSTELLIVDDGSTDNSHEIIQNTIRNTENKNIVFTIVEHAGISEVRNKAISYVKGEYILFIDGDDILDVKFWESITPELYNNYDIIEYDATIFFENNKNNSKHLKICAFENECTITHFSQLSRVFSLSNWFTWARVYKTELFKRNHVTFPKGRIYEDMATLPYLYAAATRVRSIKESLIWYRKSLRSLTSTSRSSDIEDIIYAMECIRKLDLDCADRRSVLALAIYSSYNLIKSLLIKNPEYEISEINIRRIKDVMTPFQKEYSLKKSLQIKFLKYYLKYIFIKKKR